MFHHISIGVADVERAARFYDPVMATLGFKRVVEYMPYAIAYGQGEPTLWIGLPHDQKPPTVGNGMHVGFSARTRDAVHKFHAAALANGGSDNGPPGPREMYGPNYYGAFVLDIDGNKLEATVRRATASKTKLSPRAKVKSSVSKNTSRGKKSSAPRKPKRKVRRK